MKVLHTSDLHLEKSQGERWKTLQMITKICIEEGVDVLTICGDLFDENPDTDDLRFPIQDIFSNTDFDTLILPGNHDRDVCSKMSFGNKGVVLDDPFDPWEKDDVRFIGLPCDKMGKEEVLDEVTELGDSLSGDMVNVLLYHGELLDSFYSSEDYGNEGKKRHMPLKLSYLEALPLDYVLAGHFHTKFQARPLPNGGVFVYPGSPYPKTMRETGRRKVNIFKIGAEDYNEFEINTPYFEKIKMELNPIENKDPLHDIENRIENLEPNAVPLLHVKVYIDSEELGLTETEFEGEVKKLLKTKKGEEK